MFFLGEKQIVSVILMEVRKKYYDSTLCLIKTLFLYKAIISRQLKKRNKYFESEKKPQPPPPTPFKLNGWSLIIINSISSKYN